MAENGYGMAGHIGRIPNYGRTQVNPMGSVEPPACIQNAMMTKDKKPFTYTPGGLDLSQIRTPSMARRLARQRSDEQERAYVPPNMNNGGNYNPQGGPAPPPPPPPPLKIPAPPPPPPLIIEAPNAKAVKPVPLGERPEIVIPENPIGMLRKTNSPYHWEAEKAEMQRMGPVPKFAEKVPSPLTVKLPMQQMQQNYSPPEQNMQRRNYPYNQSNQAPDSPIYRPEAQYGNQRPNSANVNGPPQTREMLVRQDSQFNKSPQPFAGQSPLSNGTPYSPTPNNNWRQPEKRDSPANKTSSPLSQQGNRGPFSPATQQSSPNYSNQSPPAFHTLPRVGQRSQEPVSNTFQQPPVQQNTSVDQSNYAPWRTNTLNRYPRGGENQPNNANSQNVNQQQAYSPPWKSNDSNNNRPENNYNPSWNQENKVNSQQQYNPPWLSKQDANNNRIQENSNVNFQNRTNPSAPNSQEQPLYQSSISIPVYGNQRKQNSQPEYKSSPQKEAVYVNQEPVFYCSDSPKTMPPWVKTQKEKTKTPPPAWCNRPLEQRRSITRDLITPPRDTNQEPEWVKKSNEMQRGIQEAGSPPKYQQTAQPNWSTRPSENRKSLPKDNASSTPGARIIPIQMEVSSTETRNQAKQGDRQPQLRIVIDMKQNPESQGHAQAPYSQPTQRIMRVLSPQLVRMDEDSRPQQHELPTLNRHFSQDSQPKTRIIPIQIESGNGGANKSFGGRY